MNITANTVYHTATQKDYDDLMAKLASQGYRWAIFGSSKERNLWDIFEGETCIEVGNIRDGEISYGNIKYFNNLKNKFGEIVEYRAKSKPKLPGWARWIARDANEGGGLWAFKIKPRKDFHPKTGQITWDSELSYAYESIEVHDPTGFYDFIRAEDLQPYEIIEHRDPNEPLPKEEVQDEIDRIILELGSAIYEAHLATQDGEERAYGVLEGLHKARKIVMKENTAK